jgi:hypothetical protein
MSEQTQVITRVITPPLARYLGLTAEWIVGKCRDCGRGCVWIPQVDGAMAERRLCSVCFAGEHWEDIEASVREELAAKGVYLPSNKGDRRCHEN